MIKLRIPLIIAGAISFYSFPGFTGKEVGNGGDAIICDKSSQNSLEGIYSLDYIAMFDGNTKNEALAGIESWEESKNRILLQLSAKSPALHQSFLEFLKFENNFDEDLKFRQWEKAFFGLIQVNDEALTRQLPPNCGINRNTVPSKDRELIQVVIRQEKPQKIIYEYDVDAYASLKNRPLQFSFLMVHEWLWDVFEDPKLIRKMNRMLHSKKLESMSVPEFADYLKINMNLLAAYPLKSGLYKWKQNERKVSSSCHFRIEPTFRMKMKMTAFNCKFNPAVNGLTNFLHSSFNSNGKASFRIDGQIEEDSGLTIPTEKILKNQYYYWGEYVIDERVWYAPIP